eukprot:Skav230371  [mRNA]  locus=scaffold2874:134757:144306:- [translate_table: standard]
MAGIFRSYTRAKSREADPRFGSNPLSFMQRARAKSKAVKGRRRAGCCLQVSQPLPTQWDWRNVCDRNYLDDVIDQGTCGSCYMAPRLGIGHSLPAVFLRCGVPPRSDIMYYSGGIYSSASSQRAEWEPVDHAVLLVGYGSENGRHSEIASSPRVEGAPPPEKVVCSLVA